MKHYIFILLAVFSLLFISTIVPAQSVVDLTAEGLAEEPQVSTTEEPHSYYILSAAKQNVTGSNIPSDFYPLYERNVVIVNSATTESRYQAHTAELTDNELFQIVSVDGHKRLQNKATKGYMVNSWGSNAAGEDFSYRMMDNSSQCQIWTGSQSETFLYNFMGDYFSIDRWGSNDNVKDNTKCWYFLPSSIKTELYFTYNEAQLLKKELSKSDSIIFEEKLVTIVNDMRLDENTLNELKNLIEETKNSIHVLETGHEYYFYSASDPYDSRGYFLYVNEDVSPVNSSSYDIDLNDDRYIWVAEQLNEDQIKLVNKATQQQIQPTSEQNQAFSMGDTDFSIELSMLGDGQFNIKSGDITFHRSNSQEHYLYNWTGGLNSASAWCVAEINDDFYKEYLSKLIVEAQSLIDNSSVGFYPGQTNQKVTDSLENVITYIQGATDNYLVRIDSLRSGIKMFKQNKNEFIYSTDEQEQYYYIVNNSTHDYCNNKMILGTGLGEKLTYTEKSLNAHGLWKLIMNEDNKVEICNYANGLYMPGDMTLGMQSDPTSFTFKNLNYQAQYNIVPDGGNPMHCQENGTIVVNWQADINSGSSFVFIPVDDEDLNSTVQIHAISASQGRSTTGIGNSHSTLLSCLVNTAGLSGECALKKLTMNLEGTTDLKDVKKVSLYKSDTDYRFYEDKATLIASMDVSTKEIIFELDEPLTLAQGNNFLWITYDVSAAATEGNKIDGQLVSIEDAEGNVVEANEAGNPDGDATIFLTQSVVLQCGDWSSKYYRIPAIATANNGDLVAVCDRRKNNNGDLPNDIDVYVNISKDNGTTWSDPITVAGATDVMGYGDASIMKNKNGRLIILCNGGNKGFFSSTADTPLRQYVMYSDDNGQNWSDPKDITNMLYGKDCINENRKTWKGIFITSGCGICTSEGDLMIVAVARTDKTSGISDYLMVSHDDGATWDIEDEQAAWTSGDEAKVVELDNGDIMMSIRRSGSREINISHDGGKTWGIPYQNSDLFSATCNGEILRYTSVNDGYDKSRIIHSVPYDNSRKNVSVLISYDEGKTYKMRKTLIPGSSAYSALTILKDGSIGCYVEEGDGGYDMVFVSFSLDWLTNGLDTYKDPIPVGISKLKRNKTSEAIYDLFGRKLEKAPNGIYVQGGQKFLNN